MFASTSAARLSPANVSSRSHRSTPSSGRHLARRLRSYTGGMPGPTKGGDDGDDDEVRALRARVATLESELATERTAKSMLENQLRACVNEVAKILAAKRELEFRLRDVEEGS